jgi:hypothetical protein
MLVRLKKKVSLSPAEFTVLFVEGGLPRCGPPRPDQLLPHRGDYSRSTREFIPPVGTWKSRRPRREPRPPKRLFPRGAPPGGAPVVSSTGPTGGWGFLLGDPHSGSQFFWRAKFAPRGAPTRGKGSPAVGVHHFGGRRFCPPPTGVDHPRRGQDPLLFWRGWSRRGGWSHLGGPFSRVGGGLPRRVRTHRGVLARVTRLELYRTGLLGKTRRKLKNHPPRRRFFLFRRRRLRGYVYGRVTPGNYFRGVTRQTFRTPRGDRFTWFEKMTTLGGGDYLSHLWEWTVRTWGGRISIPLDYNHYTRTGRFFRLPKRGRTTGRRWKLGQHPRWASPFREVRSFRWGWFWGTPWGTLLGTAREVPSNPEDPPLVGGFAAGVYWSVQKWGRSRWVTRPSGRAGHVFVDSVKRTPSMEHDATQWGGASSAGAGVLLGFEPQWLLRGGVAPPGVPRDGRRPRRGGRLLRGGWFLVGFPWRIYEVVARGWCWLFWVVRWGVTTAVSAAVVTLRGGSRFVRSLTRGVSRWVTYHLKENPLTRAVAWAVTSWSLVYSSENDRGELANPTYDYEEPNDTYFNYELDHPGEGTPDFDQLGGEGIWSNFPQKTPFKMNWVNNDPAEWVAPVEELIDLVTREIPHRVGLLVRPLVDGLIRYPGWSALEGVTLVGLGLKWTLQRGWIDFLGWAPRGAILLRRVGGWVVFVGGVYLVGSQLSYSDLRVWVVYSVGVPWREEYYFGWWWMITLGVARGVAPGGVKDFLFRQLGWSHLGGLWVGAIEAAPPEEYQPGRPPGGVFREGVNYGTRTKGGPGAWARGELGEDRTRMWGRVHPGGYDSARLILWWESSPDGELPYDPNWDFQNYWTVYPLHVGSAYEVNQLYPFTRVDPTQRLPREPHRGGNRYDLTWTHRGEVNIPQLLPPYGGFPSPRDTPGHQPRGNSFYSSE